MLLWSFSTLDILNTSRDSLVNCNMFILLYLLYDMF